MSAILVTMKSDQKHLYLSIGPQPFRADSERYYICGSTVGVFSKEEVKSVEIVPFGEWRERVA